MLREKPALTVQLFIFGGVQTLRSKRSSIALNASRWKRFEHNCTPLVDTAVSTVREVLTGHDVPAAVRLKAAVTVLQAFGAQTPAPIGETDPEKIRQMQQFDVLACL
jgi:hypothetical protein